jgi:endonuclease/exonuclease/phosphatase family metal-dependent hydrolase
MLALLSPISLLGAAHRTNAAETLRVMTFNIWGGGQSGDQPLEQTINVIQAARADLVGIQESHAEGRGGMKIDSARAIAEKLSWHHFDQGDEDTCLISRYKIVNHTPKKWGAAVAMPSGRRVWLFNAHFMHTPYQPYQLLKIPYNDAPFITTAVEAVLEARKARGDQVAALIKEIEDVRREGTPIFVTGDFNEPSDLDWTLAVSHAKCCPIPVAWPSTLALTEAGFTDAYRAANPDPLDSPGHTWTPMTKEDDPADRHDRIDFVFFSGRNVRVEKAEVVGERPARADIVVTPYPSDHRAVVATVVVE